MVTVNQQANARRGDRSSELGRYAGPWPCGLGKGSGTKVSGNDYWGLQKSAAVKEQADREAEATMQS